MTINANYNEETNREVIYESEDRYSMPYDYYLIFKKFVSIFGTHLEKPASFWYLTLSESERLIVTKETV